MRRRVLAKILIRCRRWLRAAVPLALIAACDREVTAPEGPRRVGQWETYGRVHERWYKPQPGYAGACPVVAGDLVVFGTGDGRLVGRDRATGEARWWTVVNTARRAVDAPLLAVSDVIVALAQRVDAVHL